MTKLNDGLVNLVSGMGTTRDKAGQSQYYVAPMSDQELVTAYYASSLARRIVDMPAEDACREWREWSAETAETGLIEAEEKRLGLQVKTMEAQRLARLFGGAAMFIGTSDIQGGNQSALEKPLRYDTIKRGGLRYVEVLTARQLTPGPLSERLGDGTFGRPEYWQLSTVESAGLRIHPSRLCIFHGVEPLRDYSMGLANGWGASVLQGGIDAIRRVDEAAGNAISLMFEAKVDVFGIPDLMQNLATRGDEYTQEILKRLTLAATAKGINGMLIKDALETYDQKSASFGTLDTLIDRFMQLCSAAYGIPMTLLFGMSPGGLNATGAGDTRGYYDGVRVHQTMRVEPAIYGLDECLIRSALGDRPDDVHYNWRSLWQPTAKEKAEVGKIIADTIASLDGLLADEVRATTAVNALTESGAFPGLEAAVLEYGRALPDEGEETELQTEQGEDTSPPTNDAAPRTLYVRRDVVNGGDILDWAKSQGFGSTLTADDLHVTIAFSRAPVDWMKMGQAWQSKVNIDEGGPRMMQQFGEARVLLIASDDLNWRHNHFKEMGASWDHPEYQPHITISYDPGSPDIVDVEPYRGKIVLGPEIFEEVNADWKPK